jgi:hypothetical protein
MEHKQLQDHLKAADAKKLDLDATCLQLEKELADAAKVGLISVAKHPCGTLHVGVPRIVAVWCQAGVPPENAT